MNQTKSQTINDLILILAQAPGLPWTVTILLATVVMVLAFKCPRR